ncbi:MAG: thymidine kinase [Spirochaeta sp.]|nr:thymidine kinase [Spirochaeta sp.]
MGDEHTLSFLKSLGFPELRIHHAFNHFDFTRGGRRILVIGPMGSGKTEYSSRVWRDSQVALAKSDALTQLTSTAGADRRRVFFIRSTLDKARFPDSPADALAYRGGYERLGDNIAYIEDSFGLEQLIHDHPQVGTWIIDEATFYDERIAYVVLQESQRKGLVFIFPTLILNFRRVIFNSTARMLLDLATDVFPLTAYCEHESCIADSFYTYRYYVVDGRECPALYFDPLIIVGGDTDRDDPLEPNYCTRCDEHHHLPGKEYTYLTLKPLGMEASRGDLEGLRNELNAIKNDLPSSLLAQEFDRLYTGMGEAGRVNRNALLVLCIAERALLFLFAEENLLSEEQFRTLVQDLALDRDYIERRLADSRRSVRLE